MWNFGLPLRGGPFFLKAMQTTEPSGHDLAIGGDPEALTMRELSTFLDEIRLQPNWRRTADVEADYYDGNQLDAETLQAMEDLGMAPIIENLIGPTIDAVLGLEAKTRLDFRITPANDAANKDMAEALNVKLNETERESRADRACSDAYASQIKVGLGWVEVAREHDPFRYPIKARNVHRNEMFWDWRSKEPDLSDARFLIRKRWHDADVLALVFPQHKELINGACGAWADFGAMYLESGETGLNSALTRERGWAYNDMEWRDATRKRACLYEVWYRRWVRGHVMRLPDGRVLELDKTNPDHVRAVALGLVETRPAVFAKMRMAWYLGPHSLADMPSPYKHNDFPYVPFWGKREDLTGVPYGLVRPMVPMQDEVNARNSKMVWLLAAKRVTATKGMVKDKETARREVARPDAWIDLEQNQPANAVFKVESDFQLNSQQYQSLVDKREAIKNVGGVYNAMLGKDGQANSGIAIQSLVEQGTTTLAEINDNYRFARAKVGELLLSLVIEDMGRQPQEIKVDNVGKNKVVAINKPREDGMLDNDIQRARLKVALSDVPSTPSYRMQRLSMLTEITKSLPPNLQALVIDFVMASTDLPERDQIVERLRRALNLQVGNEDGQQPSGFVPEQQVQQIVQQAVQQALQQTGAEFKDRELRIKEMDADTRRMAVESANENKVLDAALRHS